MRFAIAADITIPAAIGHLHLLWWWALDYAQNGTLTCFTAKEIAYAMLWDEDPEALMDALKQSGFVDYEPSSGYLGIHDWREYAGRLIEKRQASRARSQRARDANKHDSGSSEREPFAHGMRTQSEPSANGTQSEREPYRATVPNPTVPNPTVQNSTTLSAKNAEDGEENAKAIEPFDEFWRLYPKKVGKGAARKAWNKAKPSALVHQKILEAIPRAMNTDQWRRENGRFIPNPATWLNEGRWDDEPPQDAKQADKFTPATQVDVERMERLLQKIKETDDENGDTS